MLTSRSQWARVAAPLFILFVLASSSPLQAQFFGDGGDQEEMMRKQFRESLKQQKVALENWIISRIADIDRACELSDSQKQKLSIASKGAVKASMPDAKKNIAQEAKDMGFEFDPDEAPEEENEDENENENEAAMMAQEFFFDGMMGGQTIQVEKNKVWKSAVKKVLNEEQTTKWKDWVEQRGVYQRRVAVENFIAKVDRKLLLAPEQRDELLKYVNESYGKELYEQQSQTDSSYGIMVISNGGSAALNDADEALKKILSESQLTEWMQSFEGQLSNMGDGGGAFGAFNMIGNAAGGMVLDVMSEDVEEEDDEDNDDDEDE